MPTPLVRKQKLLVSHQFNISSWGMVTGMILNNVTKQSRWKLSRRYLEKMNSMLHPDLRELFLPTPIANTPNHFFLNQRITIKYFEHWLILTAKGLLQSSEFHGSPISWEPDIIQVSWRKKGENKDHLLFSQKAQINCQWFANNNKRLGGKSLLYMPQFWKGEFLSTWGKKKNVFLLFDNQES